MSETRVEWRDWGPAAFEEAVEAEKPVLLSLVATWCADCHEMDAETYAEPRIAANVADGFVPVRVDVDRNPRVRERYNMGGFPSTVFCAPDGTVLTGAGYLGPEGMRQVLESVRRMWEEKGADAGTVPRALAGDLPPSGELSTAIEEHLAGQLDVTFDDEHAGWGDDAKFPLPRTVEFALKRERTQALRTLDAVRTHLADDVAGGFFRYAGTRDWGDVNHEKTLDANAALVRAFANAYLYTGEAAYRDPAADAIGFLTGELWTGFAVGASVGPGAGRAYYARDAAGRADRESPRRDLTVLAGPNALAADALLAYHAYTGDDDAREYADRILDGLRRDLVDPETGEVTRYRADVGSGPAVGETDLLTDCARVVTAFTRAGGVVGEGVGVARAVADRAIDRLQDEGTFLDGPREGAGLLSAPFRPLDGNVELADALVDLGFTTGKERYLEAARDAAASFAGAADRFGVQVAGYGSLVARLVRGSPVVAVGTEPGSDLHRAAWRIADHEKVVVPNAHEEPPATAETVVDAPRGAAVVAIGDRVSEPATTPDELMATVAAVVDSDRLD